MILTDYYRLVHLPESKSNNRFDCVESTGEYEPFETLAKHSKNKCFKVYYHETPSRFNADERRKATMAISDTKNISQVFTPDLFNPQFGYGDTRGTNDALLFHFNEEYTCMEIFVARGLKNNRVNLFCQFVDGELDEEIYRLIEQSKPTTMPS